MTFEKGISGNPNGRPRGVKDRRTVFREMIEPHKQGIINKAIERALGGDKQMLRLLLGRLLPAPPKDNVVTISLSAGTLSEKSNKVLAALNDQDLTPHDAMNVMQALAFQAKIYDMDEIRKMLMEIKKTLAKQHLNKRMSME